MKIKHIYWFAPYDLTCPSTRYRGKLPLEYLERQKNISYSFVYPQKSVLYIFKFLKIYFSILFKRKNNSLIVIQKVITSRYYAWMLKILIRIHSRFTIYDIDDAEYYRTNPETLDFFMKHCETVMVSSDALKRYAQNFNENILFQTSPVPFHSHQKKQGNDVFTIGWVGDFGNGHEVSKSFSHKANLYQLFFPLFLKIEFPVKLILIGVKKEQDRQDILAFFKENSNIELEIPMDLNWAKDDWLYPKMTQFDIGIAPMLNHPFNQAKSAFKTKQYLSAGVPVIASDVGENRKFVLHQKNGLLASKPEEFMAMIRQFALMNDKEYQFYLNNTLVNHKEYSVQRYAERLIFFYAKKKKNR